MQTPDATHPAFTLREHATLAAWREAERRRIGTALEHEHARCDEVIAVIQRGVELPRWRLHKALNAQAVVLVEGLGRTRHRVHPTLVAALNEITAILDREDGAADRAA